MSRKNTLWGLAFIAIAILIIINKLDLIPHLPVLKIAITAFLGLFIYEGVRKQNFYEILIPAAVICCLYDKYLGITKITPGPLVAASVLIALGLDIMFRNTKKEEYNYIDEDGNAVYKPKYDYAGNNSKFKNCEGIVSIENGFGSTNHYVDSKNFKNAKIQNGFGATNIYFNNAEIEGNSANIKIENGFGNVNIHIPSKWALNMSKENIIGNVSVHGYPSTEPEAQIINIKIENGLGNVNVYFD